MLKYFPDKVASVEAKVSVIFLFFFKEFTCLLIFTRLLMQFLKEFLNVLNWI